MVLYRQKGVIMIGIMCAMEKEQDAVISRMKNVKESSIKGMQIHTGTLSNTEVVVCLAGIGKVEAAISTTLLLDAMKIDKVINVGVAGSVSKELKVFDIIVADRIAQWDLDMLEDESTRNYDKSITSCVCDVHMNQVILNHMEGKRVFLKSIVTGDQFVYMDSQRETIHHYFPEATCCDMEAGAIAKACKRQNVPVCILRSISDSSESEDNSVDYTTFVMKACEVIGECMEAVADQL